MSNEERKEMLSKIDLAYKNGLIEEIEEEHGELES